MTYPDGSPGRHAASATLSAARARSNGTDSRALRFPRTHRTLSHDRRAEILEQLGKGDYCTLCGGIHAGMSMPACPRVASFELDPDGKLKSAVFFADGDWDASGVYFTADVEEDEAGG